MRKEIRRQSNYFKVFIVIYFQRETNERQSPSKQRKQENKGPKQGPEDVELGEIRGGRQKEEDKPKEGVPVENAARKAPESKYFELSE